MSFSTFSTIAYFLTFALVLIWSTYILPLIKSKTNNEDFDRLVVFLETCVRSAEQLFTPEQWLNKKQYVMTQAREFISKFVNEEVTDEMLDTLVEGIVNRVKKG